MQRNMAGKTVLLSCSKTCASCKTNIGCGHGFRNNMDSTAFWHLECFCCYVCDQTIHYDDLEFSMLAGNYPYHKSCQKELYRLKCDVCKQQFTSSSYYTKHRFFNQKLCNTHWSDGTPYCSSCQRLKPRTEEEDEDTRSYFTLGDGRILCCDCHDTAIMDKKECQRLYMEIQGFFAAAGLDLKVAEQQIPLLMVEREALNEANQLRNDELWHLPAIRGICLVERARRDGDRKDVLDITNIMEERQTTCNSRLTYKCDVIAILILYGLPRLMMGSLLAHEMMHAWLALNCYYPLSPEVEEGICQVVAHMWLDSEISRITSVVAVAAAGTNSPNNNIKMKSRTATTADALSDDQYNMTSTIVEYMIIGSSSSRRTGRQYYLEKMIRLGYLLKGQIEFHTSPVYGDGFRACRRAVIEYGGLRHALDHVKLTGKFSPAGT